MTRRALLLVVVAACHDLPDLGVCGNGVIEADNGEACDGDRDGADTCTATCELVCQTSAVAGYVEVGSDPATGEALFCPDGAFACGVDRICRARSAAFQLAGGPQPFDAKLAFAGDFDGDRVDDLIGTSPTAIEVRFGTSTGTPFDNGFPQSLAASDGLAVVFDREPDRVATGRSDLAIAIPSDGLAVLASDTEAFAPELDLSLDLDLGGNAVVVVTDPDPAVGDVAVGIARQMTGGLAVRRLAVPPLLDEQVLAPCGAGNTRLLDTAIAPDRRAFVVAAANAIDTKWFACVYDGFVATATVVSGPPPDTIALANVDGDACLELVTARAVAGGTAIEVVDAGAGCALATAATALVDGTLASADRLLAAGSIAPTAGGDRDELVLTSGVYAVVGSGAAAQLQRVIGPTTADRPWVAAAVTDLDRDGILDVVAGRRQQEDVDVVRGAAVPNVYRADTVQPVTQVVAGDFDGDGFGDAALVESGNGERVSIVYGASGGLVGPARRNSELGGALKLARMTRFTWGNTRRGSDGIDDLLVVRAQMGMPPRAGVLVGEATRLLTMPRFPPTPVDSLGALAIGKLDGSALAAAAVRSTSATSSELTVFDFETAAFTTVPLAGFEVDTFRPPQLLATAAAPVLAVVAKAPPGGTATIHALLPDGTPCTGTPDGGGAVHAIDVDLDGLDELVVIDNGDARQVHVFDVAGGAACAIGAERLADALVGCADVVRVDADTLVAVCPVGTRADLYRIVGGVREPAPFAAIDGVNPRMIAGDFDGDGVRDLAIAAARGGVVGVHFLRQCPAHDTRGCR